MLDVCPVIQQESPTPQHQMPQKQDLGAWQQMKQVFVNDLSFTTSALFRAGLGDYCIFALLRVLPGALGNP